MLGSLWAKIAAIGAILLGILAVAARILSKAYTAGADSLRVKVAEKREKQRAEAIKSKASVSDLSDDDLYGELSGDDPRK